MDLTDATSSPPTHPTTPHGQILGIQNSSQRLSSIACLHSYARLKGIYPKLGLFCNDDVEDFVDSEPMITTAKALSEGFDDEDSLSWREDTGQEGFIPDPTASKPNMNELKFLGDHDFASRQSHISRMAGKRAAPAHPAEHVNEITDPNPIVAGQKSAPRTRKAGDSPGITATREDQRKGKTSNAKKRKYLVMEDPLEESLAVGDDTAFSRQDSDDEYVPGATKCRTKVGRISKSSRGPSRRLERVAFIPGANLIQGPSWKVSNYRINTAEPLLSPVQSSLPAGNPRENRNVPQRNDTPASSRRSAKKRKLDDLSAVDEGGKEAAYGPDRDSSTRPQRSNLSAISDNDSDKHFPPAPRTKAKSRQKREGLSSARPVRMISDDDDEVRVDNELSGAGSSFARSMAQETAEGPEPRFRKVGGKYQCNLCSHWTKTRGDMSRHLQTLAHREKEHICGICNQTFTRNDSLSRHIKNSGHIQPD